MLLITFRTLWRPPWPDSRGWYILFITLSTLGGYSDLIHGLLNVTHTPPTLWRSPWPYSRGCYMLLITLCTLWRSFWPDTRAAKCYSLHYQHHGGHSDLIHGLLYVTHYFTYSIEVTLTWFTWRLYVTHYITYILEVTLTWFTGCYMLHIILPILRRFLWLDSRYCYMLLITLPTS